MEVVFGAAVLGYEVRTMGR